MDNLTSTVVDGTAIDLRSLKNVLNDMAGCESTLKFWARDNVQMFGKATINSIYNVPC